MRSKPASRAALAQKYVGTAEALPNGSSYSRAMIGIAVTMSCGLT